MDRLVLDSNQIVEKAWRLRGAAMRLVEKAIKVELIALVVPEIVIEEAQNKFRQGLEAQVKIVEKAIERVERLLDSEVDAPELDIDRACEEYGQALNQRLAELDADRPSYTKVEHRWLISRALRPRRPFRDDDRGYRDALVWHSVLSDVASTEYQTYFVSGNSRDFADGEGKLHGDLVIDLHDAGLDGRVTYMRDLETFVDAIIKPALERVPTPLTVEDFQELFEAELDSIVNLLRLEIDRKGLPDLPNELFEGGAYINMLGLTSAQANDAYRLDDVSYYTSFDVLVEASFDQTVYAPDAIWMGETLDVSATFGDEKTTDLEFMRTIPLMISVVTSTERAVAPEISVELQEFYGFCRHCGRPVLSDTAEQCSTCGRPLL